MAGSEKTQGARAGLVTPQMISLDEHKEIAAARMRQRAKELSKAVTQSTGTGTADETRSHVILTCHVITIN